MKGYKAFTIDMACVPTNKNRFQYEVGKEYSLPEGSPLTICKSGFHFCPDVPNVYNWYADSFITRVCEVEALGKIVTDKSGDKCATDRIRIIRELSPGEIVLQILNGPWNLWTLSNMRRSLRTPYSTVAKFAPLEFIKTRRDAFKKALNEIEKSERFIELYGSCKARYVYGETKVVDGKIVHGEVRKEDE